MKGLIALVLGTGLMVNTSVGAFQTNNINNVEVKKVQVSNVELESKISKMNINNIEKNRGYIDFEREDIISKINVKTREQAIDIVAEKYDLDKSQLSVGKTNDNVYLVNMFDDTEETRIANLFLVVNGEVIDQKYVDKDVVSESFVQNYMKYQEVNPIDEYVTNLIVENEDNEKVAAKGVANMVSFKRGCSIDDVRVRKVSENTFVCDYDVNGGTQSVIVKDGIMEMDMNNERMIAKL